jgi:predicted kinase
VGVTHQPTLHLICGLPGSGKSTLASELEIKHRALKLSPDEWLIRIVGDGNNEKARAAIESVQWEIAQKLLSNGSDVILEFGFWSRSERETFRKTAGCLGAKTRLYYLDVPLDELKIRIAKRNANLPQDGFYVDPSAIDQWAIDFERPSDDELSE